MRLTIAAVGRMKKGPESDLVADYLKRLPWPIDIREIPISRKPQAAGRKAEEALALGAPLMTSGVKAVMLDPSGRDTASEELAAYLGQQQDNAVAGLVFVIGGPDGLDPELLARGDKRMAFGSATWPHMLVRVMLAEQLYRASSILSNHPYHRA